MDRLANTGHALDSVGMDAQSDHALEKRPKLVVISQHFVGGVDCDPSSAVPLQEIAPHDSNVPLDPDPGWTRGPTVDHPSRRIEGGDTERRPSAWRPRPSVVACGLAYAYS